MAITRLKRKALRNKLTSKLRNQKLALESATPVIKNIDIKAIQEEFKAAAKAPKATVAVEEPAKEKVVKAKAPKAEKPAKKAAPKKGTKKED